MPWVLDASVTLTWCFAEEFSEISAHWWARLQRDGAVVPAIWRLEVMNALLVAERRKRISGADVEGFLVDLESVDIQVVEALGGAEWLGVLGLARAHGLSAYDASYLHLAVKLGVPIATLDARLIAAATVAGVPTD